MRAEIVPEDRVTYAEAQLIPGRSHRYLLKQAQAGLLTRAANRANHSRRSSAGPSAKRWHCSNTDADATASTG